MYAIPLSCNVYIAGSEISGHHVAKCAILYKAIQTAEVVAITVCGSARGHSRMYIVQCERARGAGQIGGGPGARGKVHERMSFIARAYSTCATKQHAAGIIMSLEQF